MRLAFLTVVKIIVNAAIAMVRRAAAGNSGTVGDGVGAALAVGVGSWVGIGVSV